MGILMCITFLLAHCQHLILALLHRRTKKYLQNGKHHHFLMDQLNYSLASFLQILLTYRTLVKQRGRKEVNIELKKGAEFFGDIVIVPFLDSYDLVVLKTVAICEYGEWPEEDYPPYANGPGYVVSSDIAHFVIFDFDKHKLRLFKMEDVSMGVWVEQFKKSKTVEYIHSLKFFQFGCIDDYYIAYGTNYKQESHNAVT